MGALLRILLVGLLASCAQQASPAPQEVSALLRGQAPLDSTSEDSVAEANWLWPGGNIYAFIQAKDSDEAPAFGAEATELLRQAARQLEEQTPVRVYFIDDTWEAASGYYVDVMGDGDPDHISGVAPVGTANSYATWFGLYGELQFKADADISVLRHELGHVVGLWHTQRRSDRDDHITVHWDQVKEGLENQFTTSLATIIGPYDTDSIMHYSSFTFTRDKECAVITKNSTSDSCGVAPEHLIPEPIEYTTWNYVTMSALYCLPKYCGDNCASAQRCAVPAVQRNLTRLAHWEQTGEKKLPADQAICGDNFIDEGEECDSEANCGEDCKRLECGDGIVNVDDNEDCDDSGNSRVCNADCSLSRCGDGIVNRLAAESCDDGGESADCDSDCTRASCGDFVVNRSRGEECDDGGESADCNADCTPAYCGDGLINTLAGEQCDGQPDCSSLCLSASETGGCAVGNAGSSGASLLLLGLAVLIGWRRRREC